MSCRFAYDDAAYVLGALAPADRLEFERHLAGCRDCTRAVRELAGLPGLLGRIDPEVIGDSSVEVVPPVPDTVLPALARAAHRTRLRRTLVAAGSAAAAAAVATSLLVSQLVGGSDPSTPDAATPAGSTQAMDPVGEVPVEAALTLEQVTWGTRLQLTCTYDTALVRYHLPPSVDYVLVVRTRDGHAERVGSWRSVNGKTMQLEAGTAATAGEISSVQVRTPDGRVVLTATA